MAYSIDPSGKQRLVEIFGKNSNIKKIITVQKLKSVFQVNSLESKISVLYNWVSPDFIIEPVSISETKISQNEADNLRRPLKRTITYASVYKTFKRSKF